MMKRFRNIKKWVILPIILLFFQNLIPVVFAEQQSTESAQNSISELKETGSLETANELESSIGTTASSVSSEENSTDKTTKSSDSSSEQKRSSKAQAKALSENDISDSVTVNDWWIFERSVDDPVSATNAASVNKNYNFRFVWSLKKADNQMIQPGEFFCLDLPENIGIASEGISGWGGWLTSTTETDKKDIEADINGDKQIIGQWWIDWRDDGSPQGKYYIKVAFDEGVDGKNINQITGIEFTIPENSLKNVTLKGGMQEVVFGNKSKRILFEQAVEEFSTGDDYKYAANSGSNTITFDIGIGRMTLNELTGDVVDYAVNSKSGFYLDGDYHGYRWGENFTDLDDIYVEDALDPGVVVSSLSLSALVQSPIGLSEKNNESQSGGLINKNVATFESYLFADYGNGPVFRTAGSNQAIKFPKQEDSFKLVVQESGESLAVFRARVKEEPQQYGIYTKGSGKNAQRTICINIGDIHKENGIQTKYSDLTDQKYASPERTITRKAGDILGEEEVKITQFAVEAANKSIEGGFYQESDREMLENYYTLAYGDSNVTGGQVSAFNISMKLNYPLDGDLSETKSNTGLAYYANAKQQKNPEFQQPSELTGEGNMSNPYGKIAINTDSIALVKYDGATLTEMNGVEFALQKKVGDVWKTLSTHKTGELTTGEGEKVQGTIQVSNLDNGIYRFVEKAGEDNIYPEGYDQTKSGEWNSAEQRIISAELVVDGLTTNEPVFVENIPIESAPYAVEHYFLKEGRSPNSTNQSDFELNFVENETGEIRKPIGSTFEGTPRSNLLGYAYKQIDELEKASGKITAITDPNLSYNENGQLVLRFYYVPDEDSVPFSITKLDMDGKRMPSYDAQGGNLENEVSFYVYVFDWAKGKGPQDEDAKPTKGASNDYWELVETDNQGNPIQQPIKTDAHGRLRAEIDLTTDGVIGSAKTFAVVEATNTYPYYEAPSVEDAWWILWTGEGRENAAPKGSFSGCQNMGRNNPGSITEEQPDHSMEISLKNRTTKGTVKVYKSDETGKMMPSTSNKKVKFQVYEYIGGWDSEGPEPGDFENTLRWKDLGVAETDANGVIIDYEIDNLKTYALKEIETYPGFSIEPDSYWLIYTKHTSDKGFYNHDIKYVGSEQYNPGFIAPDDPDNSTGFFVLKNREEKIDFSFIKENEQEEPLGEVEFALYAGKEGKLLEIGVNDDPNAANTYWNMDQPLKTAISNAAGANMGKVNFNLTAGSYLLVETKTAAGYQLPKGQWILTIDPLNADPDQRIKIEARGDPLPPAFYKKEGNYYLPNLRKYQLPSSGSAGLIFSIVLGIVLIGLAFLVNQTGKKTNK